MGNNQSNVPHVNIDQFRVGPQKRDNPPDGSSFTQLPNGWKNMNFARLIQEINADNHLNDDLREWKAFCRTTFPGFYLWAKDYGVDSAAVEINNRWIFREFLYAKNINLSDYLEEIRNIPNDQRTSVQKDILQDDSWNANLPTGLINFQLLTEDNNLDDLLRYKDDVELDDQYFYDYDFPRSNNFGFTKLINLAEKIYDHEKPNSDLLGSKIPLYLLNTDMDNAIKLIKSDINYVPILFGDSFSLYTIFENKLVPSQLSTVLFYCSDKIRTLIDLKWSGELILNSKYKSDMSYAIIRSGIEKIKLTQEQSAYLLQLGDDGSVFTPYLLSSYRNVVNAHKKEIIALCKNEFVDEGMIDIKDKFDIFDLYSSVLNALDIKLKKGVHVHKSYVKFKMELRPVCVSFYKKKGKYPSLDASVAEQLPTGTIKIFSEKAVYTTYGLARELCPVDLTDKDWRHLMSLFIDQYPYSTIVRIMRDTPGERSYRLAQFVYMIFPDGWVDFNQLNPKDSVFWRSLLLLFCNDAIMSDRNLHRKIKDPSTDGFVRNFVQQILYIATRGHMDLLERVITSIMTINPRSNFDNMMQIRRLKENGYSQFQFYNKEFKRINDSIFDDEKQVIEMLRRICEHDFYEGHYFVPLSEGIKLNNQDQKGYSIYFTKNATDKTTEDATNIGKEFYHILGCENTVWNYNLNLNERDSLRDQPINYRIMMDGSEAEHQWKVIDYVKAFNELNQWINDNVKLDRDIVIANYNHRYGLSSGETVQQYYDEMTAETYFSELYQNGQLVGFKPLTDTESIRENVVNSNAGGSVESKLKESIAANTNIFIFNLNTAQDRFANLYGDGNINVNPTSNNPQNSNPAGASGSGTPPQPQPSPSPGPPPPPQVNPASSPQLNPQNLPQQNGSSDLIFAQAVAYVEEAFKYDEDLKEIDFKAFQGQQLKIVCFAIISHAMIQENDIKLADLCNWINRNYSASLAPSNFTETDIKTICLNELQEFTKLDIAQKLGLYHYGDTEERKLSALTNSAVVEEYNSLFNESKKGKEQNIFGNIWGKLTGNSS